MPSVLIFLGVLSNRNLDKGLISPLLRHNDKAILVQPSGVESPWVLTKTQLPTGHIRHSAQVYANLGWIAQLYANWDELTQPRENRACLGGGWDAPSVCTMCWPAAILIRSIAA
jgi:hypothetical protein